MVFSIELKKRQDQKVEAVRAGGLVPGVLYGPERTPVSVAVGMTELQKLYDAAGESNLIDVRVEGEPASAKALIQEVQYDPVKGQLVHVDFHQINMSKEMEVAVQLHFIGEAPAVKGLGGTLMKNTSELKVKCLPKDLVGSIDIDLSTLNTFEDAIHIKDIALPAGLKAIDDPQMLIVKVTAPLTEEQLKAMEAAEPQSIEDVEVEKKGKKEEEGEEGAEGAEAAPAPEAAKKEPAKKE